MGEMAEIYEAARRRVQELARSASPEELERSVPACPDWSVKDLFAHVVGVGEDTAAMNVGAAGSEEWTRSHIERRKPMSVEQIDSEWEQLGPKIASTLNAIPPGAGAALVGDLVTHELDMLGALQVAKGGPEEKALAVALERYVKYFGKRVKDAGLPAVAIRDDAGHEWVAGKGDPQVSLSGSVIELLRALTGRRTEQEIKKLGWDGDPTPYIPLLSNYGMPAEVLREWSPPSE